ATIVAGVFALVIATVFKLLLAITVIAGAVAMIARSFGRSREQLAQYPQGAMADVGNGSAWNRPIQPVGGYSTSRGTSIVPID
ncbi:MAG TPA: hypothetical protein VLJ41_13255, partial [Segetibacter sp.]|nr:hypothetical protein [Segetibacter sp.]